MSLPIKSIVALSACVLMFAACGTSVTEASRGGGNKGSTAQNTGQKSGDKAKSQKSNASSRGTESQGILCDDSTEGLAWCETEWDIVFCADGEWWILDCTYLDEYAFCGIWEDTLEVDCFVEEDF